MKESKCYNILKYNNNKGKLSLTITQNKLILEKEKGIFKKTKEIIDYINIKMIKTNKGNLKISRDNSKVTIETITGNIIIEFKDETESKDFIKRINKIVNNNKKIEMDKVTKLFKELGIVLTTSLSLAKTIKELYEEYKK